MISGAHVIIYSKDAEAERAFLAVAITGAGRYGMVVFGLLMASVQVVVFFGPPPSSDRGAAATAFTLYAAFAAAVYWLEKKRVPKRHMFQ